MNRDYDYPTASVEPQDERVAAVQRLVILEQKLEALSAESERADRALNEVRQAHRQHRQDVAQMLGFGETVPF